jgi:hypothetical protein
MGKILVAIKGRSPLFRNFADVFQDFLRMPLNMVYNLMHLLLIKHVALISPLKEILFYKNKITIYRYNIFSRNM